MNPDISHVANAFYVGAVVLGLPSLAGMLFSIVFGVRLWSAPASTRVHATKNPDAIIMTIEGMARIIGAAAGLVGAVGKLVAILLAALSIGISGISGLLFFTGRGLQAHEAWARETAGVVLGFALLGALLSLVTVRRWWRSLSLLGVIGTIYALLAIWRGYPA